MDATTGRDMATGTRPMVMFVAAAGLMLIAPVLWIHAPWFVVWAIVLIVPHFLIAMRVTRNARNPTGPAVALGVCLVIIVAGAILIVLQWRRAGWLPLLYSAALIATHTAMAKNALTMYKNATYTKPHWRLLGRGLADALVYYAIVLVIAAGTRIHLD